MSNTVHLNLETGLALRRVRLHHWMLVLEGTSRMGDRRASRHTLEDWKHQHDEHMRHVQALNALFPVGDTAERDRDHVARYGELPGEAGVAVRARGDAQ